MADTKESTREIATRLGSAFSVVVFEFLPAVTEALGRSTKGKEISFGCTVHLKSESGVIAGRMTCHEPKIPTTSIDPIHFLLQRDDSGQLSFLFDGSLKEMRLELAERDVKPSQKEDGYTPSDSVGQRS